MQLRRADEVLNRQLVRRALLQAGLHGDQAQAARANLINRLFGANEIGDAMLGRALPIVGVFNVQLGVRMQQPALAFIHLAISAEHFWKRRVLGIGRAQHIIGLGRQHPEGPTPAWSHAAAQGQR